MICSSLLLLLLCLSSSVDAMATKATATRTIALVTGGNRGIGREVCRQLKDLGYTVVLGSRNADKGQVVAEELGGPPLVRSVELDVTSTESVQNAQKFVEKEFGVLDVLVNNAGINYDTYQRTVSADLDNVRETMETNLYGPWSCTMIFRSLLEKSSNPRVVNVSSGAGSLTGMGGGTPAYSISKAALNALTIKLAAELPNMRVNAVCPGWIATDMGGAGGGPIEQGGQSVVYAATLPQDGPTGGFFRDGKPTVW